MTSKRRQYGARDLKVRVKTAKGRKLSSTHWLQRQLNDPYVAKAKEQGYRSRAAFKLLEIDEKADLLRTGQCVVDLGSAPGSWSQIAAHKVQSGADNPSVFALDILPMEAVAGVEFLQEDFTEEKGLIALQKALHGRPVDVVLSDMAAPTTGHRQTDHLRTQFLFEIACDFALAHLVQGGSFLSKVFRGGAQNTSVDLLKNHFGRVKHIKPLASRPESPELYVLATDFKKPS
jgi:23S rRNA (uridine2552-2'-O)-methyltransferase